MLSVYEEKAIVFNNTKLKRKDETTEIRKSEISANK
ncbi:hypothetical protein CNEO2_10139 [Clostridium neonatale]|nr:hypothetical protein CNEO2_10139 [Clostridium neonatale]CAI3563958.1 hypothetical protein CNEO4_120073 [Clostridium neonatale]